MESVCGRSVRYEPPYYYEFLAEDSETGPTRRKAVALIASAWRSLQAREWLRSAVQHDVDWIVRSAAAKDLARGWRLDPGTLPLLKDRARSDEEGLVRRTAIQEWVRSRKLDPEALTFLKNLARSDESSVARATAIQEWVRGWKLDPDVLPLGLAAK